MTQEHKLTKPHHLRQHNRSLILKEIFHTPGISRRELADVSKLTEASLSRITKDLIDEGLIQTIETRPERLTRGRPNVGLTLCQNGMYILCICLTAFEQKLSIVAANGERLTEDLITGWPDIRPNELIDQIATHIDILHRRPDLQFDKLKAVSLTIAGDIDTHHDAIISARPGIRDIDTLYEQIAKTFNLPICLQNTSIALHIAETRNKLSREPSNSLLLYSGIGVGASLMIKGLVSHGSEHESSIGGIMIEHPPLSDNIIADNAEHQHQTAIKLDDISSGRAILHRLGQYGIEPAPEHGDGGLHLALPHAIRQANSGERRAVAAFSDAGRTLGLAFQSTLALAQPEFVILAGPVAAAHPFVDGFDRAMRDYNAGSSSHPHTLKVSKISSLMATEIVGLERFLLSKPLID